MNMGDTFKKVFEELMAEMFSKLKRDHNKSLYNLRI